MWISQYVSLDNLIVLAIMGILVSNIKNMTTQDLFEEKFVDKPLDWWKTSYDYPIDAKPSNVFEFIKEIEQRAYSEGVTQAWEQAKANQLVGIQNGERCGCGCDLPPVACKCTPINCEHFYKKML